MKTTRIIQIIVIGWFLAWGELTLADYIELSRSAILKASPDTQGTTLERADKGSTYLLLDDGEQQNGYYKVWLSLQRKEAFVYRTRARRKPGELPSSVATSASTGAGCQNHLIYGVPHDSDQILCRLGYVVGYNYTQKVPDWAAYYIIQSERKKITRKNKFITDKDLPSSARSSNSDYAKSGYDRGHIAPSATISISQHANDETFYFSNMTPQLPGFNRNMMGYSGVWGATEDGVRDWLKDRPQLYVIAGTHFDNDQPKTIGPHKVGVPDYFFKIVFDPIKVEAIGFWMPQDANTADQISSYVKTIDEIEKETGFDFLANLNDEVEKVVEAHQIPYETWVGE